MYKPADKTQTSFLDFDRPMGLHMNLDNHWIRMADKIPWDLFEAKDADLFPSDTGNVATPLRMALGALIIQTRFQFPDRELVEQITENPYLQYFIGLPGYQDTPSFDASTLVLFRKRITADMLNEANEYLFAHKDDDQPGPPSSGNGTDETGVPKEEGTNKGICIYHKPQDLWEIPLYIKRNWSQYDIYIRHHTDLLNETVCYAVSRG